MIHRHSILDDWCHLCGKQSDQMADVWYSRNAEHANNTDRHVRMCAGCAASIARAARLNRGTPPQADAQRKPQIADEAAASECCR